jgi:hypothetical protein
MFHIGFLQPTQHAADPMHNDLNGRAGQSRYEWIATRAHFTRAIVQRDPNVLSERWRLRCDLSRIAGDVNAGVSWVSDCAQISACLFRSYAPSSSRLCRR